MKDNREFKQRLIGRAYDYALRVMKLVDKLPKDRSSFIISDQLIRSATSIGANIIEAQSASSRKDFANFLNHSLKSANESRFWLGLIRDSNKAPADEIGKLLKETDEFAKILASSILTLRGNKLKL